MNIEQKNTLFVVIFLLAVLGSVSAAAYLLVTEHVNNEIAEDLKRAQRAFTETQTYAFERMVNTAHGIAAEPALVAASLTGDLPTVRAMLEDLHARPDVDLLAIFLDTGPTGVVAESRKPHLTSPQMLSSEPITNLVRQLIRGDATAYGNALVYDTLLRLAAVPIENPLGGRVGVLVVGEELDAEHVGRLQQLVRADILLLKGNVILSGSIAAPAVPIDELVSGATSDGLIEFTSAEEVYHGMVFPILTGPGREIAAQILLAFPSSEHWSPYFELARNAAYFSALILLLAALAGISVSRATLTRPIKVLAEAIRAIGGGNLTVTVSEARKDELGELAHSFNEMLQQLNASRGEIEASRQRFSDFAASSSDWLWETDTAGRFTYLSPGAGARLGFATEDLIGRSMAELFPQSELGALTALIRRTGEEARPFQDIEVWITTREGQRQCLLLNGIPARDGERFLGFRGTAKDTTAAKHDEEKLLFLANQDHLTGLANRRRFMADLAREIQRAERHGTQGALLLLDLDHFKLINDTAGHAAGDEVIVQVASLLRRQSRTEDTISRLSGDEFALVFPDMDVQQALSKSQQILVQIAQLKPRQAGKVRNISASIGIASFPGHGTSPVELLAKADTAMYGAKNAGRNRAQLFNEGDMALERMGSQITWKERIHQALEEDWFMLGYQPIAPTNGEPAHHFEVLVRMKDASGAVHMPGNFIPTAEQFGLIRDVDKVIVRKAIRELARMPISDEAVSFSINLSGLSLSDPEVLDMIEREIEASGLYPGRLTFEVTETAACENMTMAIDFMSRIRALGCRISLDDFGVGFSSFSYLKHLRVDMIKIDGSFIRHIHTSTEDQLFVKALVDVAKGMGVRTTAEFVENAEALAIVRSLGVDYAQGYYIGRPQTSILHSVGYNRKAGSAA